MDTQIDCSKQSAVAVRTHEGDESESSRAAVSVPHEPAFAERAEGGSEEGREVFFSDRGSESPDEYLLGLRLV